MQIKTTQHAKMFGAVSEMKYVKKCNSRAFDRHWHFSIRHQVASSLEL